MFLAAAVLAGLGFGVVTSGIVPITASSGHWPITEWFLHFTMRRSVATHALLVDVPPEDLYSRARLLRGARHYETGCRLCHGAPGDRLPPIPQAMTPHPPDLASRASHWSTRQLFYLIRHGVKFTGMPGWPAPGRDDEVWAVVAFVEQMPGMSAERYRALALGDDVEAVATPVSVPDVVLRHCARCHGLDGVGRDAGAFPKINGQRLEYVRRALEGYAAGTRHSGMMEPIAAGLRAPQREGAARYYAALPPPSAIVGQDPARVMAGEILARRGNPRRNVPACGDCHLPGGARINDAYPGLAGQYPDYLVQQLQLLQSRVRGGSEFVHLMHKFVDNLEEDDMRNAAAFFAAQPGSR
jgi:cytochrome c553